MTTVGIRNVIMALLIPTMVVVAGCGGQKANGKFVDTSNAGSSVDKPNTTSAVLDATYTTKLTVPVANSGVQVALSNLLYTPNSGAQMLMVTNTGMSSSCSSGGAFYFTWSVLGADKTVLDEVASPTRIIESGHQYLLRVYPTRLDAGCTASIKYSVSGGGAITNEGLLMWPKVSYYSYQRFVVGTVWQPDAKLSLEMPEGIPTSGDLKMRLNILRTRPNGERTMETVFNVDGMLEKLTIANGKIMAACTQSGVLKSVQVGAISEASITIEKKILATTGECKETARLLRFNRAGHGLVDFTVLSNVGQPIRAVMAPLMGSSTIY